MRALSISMILLASSLIAQENDEVCCQRIYAHLLLSDFERALLEGKGAFERFPESKKVKAAYLQALSEQGEEFSSLQVWSQTPTYSLDDPMDRKMLETLSWGVLRRAGSSSQILVRLNALVGASFTHDAKAIPLLLAQLRSSNASLRAFAVRMASQFGDDPLKREIARLLKEEQVWFVRQEVILAAGRMHLHELKPLLQEIIASPRSLAEEKAMAMSSLVGMYDSVAPEELNNLARSDRAGLRSLCAELIGHFVLKDHSSHLFLLLQDTCADVRMAALHALSLLRLPDAPNCPVVEEVGKLLDDPSSAVSSTAAYVLLLYQVPRAKEVLVTALRSEVPQWRQFASAAIASSGSYGVSLAQQEFALTKDPYVKINLARALIGQRVDVQMAAKSIHEILQQENKVLWMWKELPISSFRTLAPSEVRHREGMANYPAVVDQLARLELLSILSLVEYEAAPAAVREFLKTKSWSVSGVAASLVLQEGSEDDLDAVRSLLHDPDQKIRCLAALILAAVGKDNAAVNVLQEVYPFLDRDLKMHVLQALGYVGDTRSIPFLLTLLHEPFQLLRVAAAAALIQCLYH